MPIPVPALSILFVDDPAASAAFYAGLFATTPSEQSATFAMLPLGNGTVLGLWSRHTAIPAPTGEPGAAELAFTAPEVDPVHADWSARGVEILQPPTDLDFGRSFVALDPDGHRLRVFAPPA